MAVTTNKEPGGDRGANSRHKRHIDSAIASAKKELGPAWDLLGERVREAFVCKHAMATLAARTDVAGWSDAAEFAYETLNAVQETA